MLLRYRNQPRVETFKWKVIKFRFMTTSSTKKEGKLVAPRK